MIARKIRPEELKRTQELYSIAFEREMENSKTALQVYEETISNPKSREDYYCMERWAAFEDDDQTMMSYFITKPYPVHFDGHHCKMFGIGGVATLPPYRRRGGIRTCFEAALPAMYEDGVEFSYLYPFSTAYYRKFGYELCCERLAYRIRLSAICPFPVEGGCHLVEPGNFMTEDIKSVYEAWQKKYNMMIENEEYEYAWIRNSNPARDQCFTYVYKSKDKIPKGFITFQKAEDIDGRNLKCSRFFYRDLEGFKGLLNLVQSCSSDHSYVSFELPSDQIITPLLPEWSMGAGSCEKVFHGMVRVIHVQKVLKAARYRGSGTLRIQIDDPYIPQNNHTFCIHFEHGTATNVSFTGDPPHISLGIGDFSRLITGACDTGAIEFMETVHLHTSMEQVAQVFYSKPVLITESF